MRTRLMRMPAACFTGIVFIFLLYSGTFPAVNHTEEELTSLVKQGEALFHMGQFEQAMSFFQRALSVGNDSPALNRLYLIMSRTYFRLNDLEKSEEYLRKVLESEHQTTIDEAEFEEGYRMIFNKIGAEYWFSVRSVNQVDKQEDRRIIARMSEKPEKKKNKVLPLLLAGGVLAGSVVALVLLMGGGSNENIGSLKINNHSGSNITLTIGTVVRSIEASKSVLINLEAGSYTAEILYLTVRYTYPVEIRPNQTSVLTFYKPN